MKWKDFLYFQSGEKIAILLLLVLIVLVVILNIVMSDRGQALFPTRENDSLTAELNRFNEQLTERTRRDTFTSYETKERQPQRQYSNYNKSKREEYPRNTYTPYPKAEKLSAGETISLNEIDTAQWKKIPGIGSAFADRIVKYRNLLGGYSSINQLREVYGFDNELFSKIAPFVEEDGNFAKVAINKSDLNELKKHPYINYKQAKAITDLRRRKGNILSIDELSMLDEFTETDLERLKPYLSFN